MTDLKKRFHHFIVNFDTHKCTLSTGNVAVLSFIKKEIKQEENANINP